MADVKPLYSTCVAVLGFVCFVVGATAVGIPMWGYFGTPFGGHDDDKGYFGPWKTCKWLLYGRERCEPDTTRFKPSIAVYVSGIVAVLGVIVLGMFCILSVLQLAMISSKEKVVMKYSVVVITKVALALLAALLAIAAAGLFALQTDDKRSGFEISRGPAFYIQILAICLNAALFVMTLYDMLFSRKEGGDPTNVAVAVEATTYGNPGFRDRGTNGVVSVTDASGKPYVGASNGSMASMNTTSTTLGSTNGSTAGSSSVAMSRSPPLRSSLKKPKPKDGLGIQNPGFAGTSPTLSRNGSTKKVRIQTHSTEV